MFIMKPRISSHAARQQKSGVVVCTDVVFSGAAAKDHTILMSSPTVRSATLIFGMHARHAGISRQGCCRILILNKQLLLETTFAKKTFLLTIPKRKRVACAIFSSPPTLDASAHLADVTIHQTIPRTVRTIVALYFFFFSMANRYRRCISCHDVQAPWMESNLAGVTSTCRPKRVRCGRTCRAVIG
jgi:hypothetical protein